MPKPRFLTLVSRFPTNSDWSAFIIRFAHNEIVVKRFIDIINVSRPIAIIIIEKDEFRKPVIH